MWTRFLLCSTWIIPPLFSPRSFTSHYNSQFAHIPRQRYPPVFSSTTFQNLIRIHLPITNSASFNQVETLLIRPYNISNGFQAWYVKCTHSLHYILLLKIISGKQIHHQLNSIVDKAQIKSARRLALTIIPAWRECQLLDSLAIPSAHHSIISHKPSQATWCQAMPVRLS